MRCTKIICTIGPSSREPEMLKRLQQAGMNIARLNFSHADHNTHGEVIRRIRDLNQTLKYPVAIMLDTQGPEIRTGFNEVNLEVGDELRITVPPTEEAANSEVKTLHVNYQYLIDEVKPGQSLSVDSGLVKLKVLSREDDHLRCEVIHGGFLKGRRHVNLPGVAVQLPSITAKDKEDLLFAKEMDLDGIALSFVRNADAVREAKEILGDESKGMKIIAKIENQEGVENMEQILEEADGIMVARGDLGIECPFEELPIIQRKAVGASLSAGKPVIVATHMLESMIDSPVPTRAEISDVANAVNEGADCIMLSGETTTGKYPFECVRMLTRIASRMEEEIQPGLTEELKLFRPKAKMLRSAAMLSMRMENSAVLVFTRSGDLASKLGALRPNGSPLFAFTDVEGLHRRLRLIWGIEPFLMEFSVDPEITIQNAINYLKTKKWIEEGDQLVIVTNAFAHNRVIESIQLREIEK